MFQTMDKLGIGTDFFNGQSKVWIQLSRSRYELGIFLGEILIMDFERAGETDILYIYFRRGGTN